MQCTAQRQQKAANTRLLESRNLLQTATLVFPRSVVCSRLSNNSNILAKKFFQAANGGGHGPPAPPPGSATDSMSFSQESSTVSHHPSSSSIILLSSITLSLFTMRLHVMQRTLLLSEFCPSLSQIRVL